MTASELIRHLEHLPAGEIAKVREWLAAREEDSPELLAAIDEGLRSHQQKGARIVTRDELVTKVRQWTGGSH